MNQTYDVVIVGAGIVGAACADGDDLAIGLFHCTVKRVALVGDGKTVDSEQRIDGAVGRELFQHALRGAGRDVALVADKPAGPDRPIQGR